MDNAWLTGFWLADNLLIVLDGLALLWAVLRRSHTH